LSEEEEVQDPHKEKIQEKEKGQASHQSAKGKEDHQGTSGGKRGYPYAVR
jgi:hypothetical protein